jgi:GntR family transcriptional regulator
VKSLSVDPRSAVPPFEQIRGQIAALIGAGTLRAGDRLPPVRQLAADLGIAVGTVNRAYRELEAEGLVLTRRRTGTHVAEAAKPTSEKERTRLLAEAAAAYVHAAHNLGMDDEATRAALERVLSDKKALPVERALPVAKALPDGTALPDGEAQSQGGGEVPEAVAGTASGTSHSTSA